LAPRDSPGGGGSKPPADLKNNWFQKVHLEISNWHLICRKPRVLLKTCAIVRSEAEINAAIRDCLDHFRPGGSVIAHLATYLERLRRQSWQEEEISEVEIGVRRILTKLVDDDSLDEL
jgi:hypothetical protein